MPINVTCANCDTTLKAPDNTAGKRVKCPKCAAVLTVPFDGVLEERRPVPVFVEPPEEFDEPPRRSSSRRDRDDEDYDEPRRRQPRRPVAASGESGGAQMGLGIGSLCVGIIAALVAIIPCIGMFISIPLAVIGLILGVVGLIIALTQKNKGIGMPIAGSAVNGVAILISVAWWFFIVSAANTGMNQAAKQMDKMMEQAERMQKNQLDNKQKDDQAREKSKANLRQLALAMQQYADVHGKLPKAAGPNLSWRVALLPYLGQDDLYRQFKQDESWLSPHNKKLLSKMPDVYRPVRKWAENPGQHFTFYQVFAGMDGPFAQGNQPTVNQFLAGTSNTFLIVEAGAALEWTNPNDIWYEKDRAIPKLGYMFDNGFHAALADSSVRWFDTHALNEIQLRAAITSDPKGPPLPNP